MSSGPTIPSNSHYYSDVPDGEPATNDEFWKMLRADSSDYSRSQSNIIGDDGSTWWFIAKMEKALVEEKYKKWKMGGVVINIDDEGESDSSMTRITKQRPTTTRNATMVKRDTEAQHGAPRQLKFLSLPSSANNDLDGTDSYKYDVSAGKGTRVYVIDSGLNFGHNEWTSDERRQDPEFLFAEPFSAHHQEDLDKETGHGTCLADLAVGRVNGVAKEADLTAVQIDDFTNERLKHLPWELTTDALSKVADDISKRELGEKAVVLIAFTAPKGEDGSPYQDVFQKAFIAIMEQLDSLDVSLVVAVPNDQQCDSLPCILGDPSHEHHMPNLITVGEGLINDGDYSSPDEDLEDWVTIYGPGDDRSGGDYWDPGFDCLAPEGDENSDIGQGGTSHASAMVAGLMAYYKGLGLSNHDARARLLSDAYRRKPDGPAMPWNGHE